jgi:predicted TIM-barrel fold metal-dependent hydrolase
MSRPIYDLRSRPAFLHAFYGSTPGTPGHATARWLNQRVGSKEELHFERSYTLDGYLQEVRDAGITAATLIGRDTPSVAFRYANVLLAPDMYVFLPGSQLYIEAANSFLREQFLFGSSFPFRPMRQSVDDFLTLGLNDAALEAALHGNAERLMKLTA